MRKLIIAILLMILLVSGGVMVYHFYEEREMEANSARAREMLDRIMPAGYENVNNTEDYEAVSFGLNIDAIRSYFGNDDIVAHLRIEGTTIDYLVVQGNDNSFYVTHDIWRDPAASGWIFLDYEADIENMDHNWIIYGHNMQRDHKFHSLRRYASYEFFRNHPIITLTTPSGVYLWEVFSFYSTPITFSYNTVNFANPQTMQYILGHFLRMSRHDADVVVTTDDRILTLSTCTNRYVNERYVLHARLIASLGI